MLAICPTITVNDAKKFQRYAEELASFTNRIHVDAGDREFTGNDLLPLENMWLPKELGVDLHAMFEQPRESIETMISLSPQLIIFHAESKEFREALHDLDGLAIKRGVALLQETPVESIKNNLDVLDHVLIFSGSLGTWGGQADLSLLSKVQLLKTWKPELEIGWDGGVNDSNIAELAQGGVDVVNVGGYIARAENPSEAYTVLHKALPQ